MANLHPQQFEQLDMFRPAHKLAGMKMGDAHARESNSSVMNRKRADMEGKSIDRSYVSLKEDLHKRGIVTPVKIWHNHEGGEQLGDGHHRVTHAMDTNPSMEVPVTHAAPMHSSYDW